MNKTGNHGIGIRTIGTNNGTKGIEIGIVGIAIGIENGIGYIMKTARYEPSRHKKSRGLPG